MNNLIYNEKLGTYIEHSIYDLIVELNQRGYKTEYSCSGIMLDKCSADGHSLRGYISFKKDRRIIRDLIPIANRLNIDVEYHSILFIYKSVVFYSPYNTSFENDQANINLWNEFLDELKKFINEIFNFIL